MCFYTQSLGACPTQDIFERHKGLLALRLQKNPKKEQKMQKEKNEKNGKTQGAFARLARLEGHAREVTSLLSTASNGMVWSSSLDSTIRIWNTSSHACDHIITRESREGRAVRAVGILWPVFHLYLDK